MPGCRIKYCEIECGHKTEEEVKQDSYKNRIFSTYDAERMAEVSRCAFQLSTRHGTIADPLRFCRSHTHSSRSCTRR